MLLSNRAGARLMTNKPLQALDDALAATRVAPKFVKGFMRVASCYTRLGDFSAARDAIDNILDRCGPSSSSFQELMQRRRWGWHMVGLHQCC